MKRELTVSGPVRVQATLRASDLVVTAGEHGVVGVVLESSRDAAERSAFAASTFVELVGDVLHVEAQLPRFFSRERTRIHLTLPPGSSLTAGTGSGDITCSASLPRAVVRSGSGDVQLTEADDVEVVTGSGSARVTALGSGRVQTGSGDVWVGLVRESLSTRTGSGDVRVGAAGQLESTSGSGDIAIDELRGTATLRSASGAVTVDRAVSGTMTARTTSGDVRVAVSQGTAVLLDCSTVSGRMRSELEATGEAGPDEPTLELNARTVSGDLVVARAR